MRYCIRCSRDIGEGHDYCPHCGTPQRKININSEPSKKKLSWYKTAFFIGVVVSSITLLLSIALAFTLHEPKPSDSGKIFVNVNGSVNYPFL